MCRVPRLSAIAGSRTARRQRRAARFTKILALEVGKFGVTANAVAPGFIVTDMTRATAGRLGVSFDEFRSMIVKDVAVARGGLPADVASAVSFFVSEEAGFVSGQVLYVAGGPRA